MCVIQGFPACVETAFGRLHIQSFHCCEGVASLSSSAGMNSL